MSPRWSRARLRRAAQSIFHDALAAANPARLIQRHLRVRGLHLDIAGTRVPLPRRRLVLVAAGKAAVPMARAAERALGRHLSEGVVITNDAPSSLGRLRVRPARHPVPDARGRAAARDVERLAHGLGRDDLLLVLLSGGASALLPAPAEGITLRDKQRVTEQLLRAGATIQELNAVRKHLSRLKGGGLAAAAVPARVVTLILSDVVGDDLSTIASGPTVPDPTTFAEALDVLARRGVAGDVPRAVLDRLEAGARGEVPETPKPGDKAFRHTTIRIIGSNRVSVAAGAKAARRQGLRPLVLTTSLEGEAREVARVLVAILRECVETARPASPPVCLLAGGETTVTVRGAGEGGRNQELAVAAAMALEGFATPAVVASLGTDGIDGASDAAGGVVDDQSVARANSLGLAPPGAFLAANDSRNFLGPLGDLIVTGPTGTNVVDVVALLAGPPPARGL